MGKVKKVLEEKLAMARTDLCKDAATFVTGPTVGKLAKCIREKRASTSADDNAKNDQVYDRVKAKTDVIFSTLRRKCVAAAATSAGQQSAPKRFVARTLRKFKMLLKQVDGNKTKEEV